MMADFDETVMCLQSVPNFQDKIVIIVTKMDQCEPELKNTAMKDIREIFNEENITRVIFTQKNADVTLLANEMFSYVSRMQKT